jgi:hypothetical protein
VTRQSDKTAKGRRFGDLFSNPNGKREDFSANFSLQSKQKEKGAKWHPALQ